MSLIKLLHESWRLVTSAAWENQSAGSDLSLHHCCICPRFMQGNSKKCFVSRTNTDVNKEKNERNSKGNDRKQVVKARRDFHYFKRPFVRCGPLFNIRCYYGATHKIAPPIDTLFWLDLAIPCEAILNHPGIWEAVKFYASWEIAPLLGYRRNRE